LLLLTIETATPVESIALVNGRDVLASRVTRAGRGRGDELVASVREVLASSSRRLPDLDGIAVSIGPGRFTGLRVGLATAKGLSASTGLPLFGVRTLDALAASAALAEPDGPMLVAPMLDARRGEVYAALLMVEPDRAGGPVPDVALSKVLPDRAEEPLAFLGRALERAQGSQVVFVGTGASLYRREMERVAGDLARFPGEGVDRPWPLAMARMAESAGARGSRDDASLRPMYLRGV
jgi:tRNA threonylcarbamoyladenosine biosynthesis protein TsaB